MPISGDLCSRELLAESDANDGGETQRNVEARGEVVPTPIENYDEGVPAVQQWDRRWSPSQADSSSEDSSSYESSSSDEEALGDDYPPISRYIAAVGVVPDKASGAFPKYSVGMQESMIHPTLKNETIREMTFHFVRHFMTLHVALSSEEIRTYYQTISRCEVASTATLLEDNSSDKLWKRFFGEAANKIKKKTYVVKVRGNLRTDDGGDGLDAYLERANKRGHAGVDSNGDRPTETDSLIIADCLDARHVMVYDSLKAKKDAHALDVLLAKIHQLLLKRKPRLEPPDIGDVVGLVVASDCVQRVLVIKVIEDVAVVWSIDHGRFHEVEWCNLINVAESLRQLPPAVSLAVIQDVQAMPFLKLLRECVRVLRVVTHHDNAERAFHKFMVTKVTATGVLDVLCDLLQYPDYVTRITAIKCLFKISSLKRGRRAVVKAACVPRALLCLDYFTCSHLVDESVSIVMEEMRALLNLLQVMFFSNEQLRLECAYTDVLAIVVRIHKSLHPTNVIRQDVERSIRAILAVPPARRTAEQQKLRKWQQARRPWNFIEQELNVPLSSACTDGVAAPAWRMACSFLNTWKPCSIYFGINQDGVVLGVILTRKERDALRCGFDLAFTTLRPQLPSSSYDVKFVPVLRRATDKPEEAHLFVVQVWMCGVCDTVYTTLDQRCFLREGDRSYQAGTFDVREWIVRIKEEYYLQAEKKGSLKNGASPATRQTTQSRTDWSAADDLLDATPEETPSSSAAQPPESPEMQDHTPSQPSTSQAVATRQLRPPEVRRPPDRYGDFV
ncbi:hypothetical protein HPB51_003567 [Rhipicephalus microplus]|uniref:Tudor domain-containing protein n=1 Tax=Rhipicephalus microplus TaxID=6941 RepID=A0A9J6E5V9_RHIMP|nr:hypothetical protein HPB51_003567 [Rhipicephalus microplus]